MLYKIKSGHEVEYLPKILSNLMILQKSVILQIFHQFDQKHNVAHFQYVLYPYTDG